MANTWENADGLFIRFGEAEGNVAKGGEYMNEYSGICSVEFVLDYTDALSATNHIVGWGSSSTDGSWGVQIPSGARILGVNVLVQTPFTSSGTIGTSTLLLGLIKASDHTTELDYDGFLTSSFVGSKLDAAGERNYQEVGTTGSGALIGTTLTEDGLVSTSNSQHASHPYTAGVARIRIDFFYPGTTS